MRTPILTSLFTVAALGLSLHAQAAEKKEADPAPAPSVCADLAKQLDDLDAQAEAVCSKDDEASLQQCDALEKQAEGLEHQLEQNGCFEEGGPGNEGGEEEGLRR